MADVRSLLKNERETRRINHPHALYTQSGKLLCSICNISIKTESVWNKHIKNPEHINRLQKLNTTASDQAGKKRKADDDSDQERKRARGSADHGKQDEREDGLEQEALAIPEDATSTDTHKPDSIEPVMEAALASVSNNRSFGEEEDEEWRDLQRAIDAAETGPATNSALVASATISAPAMSAEEIAAQARQEQSVQKGRREDEIAAEREDATRAMEDEFQEMEELEERVRKLREKREALRTRNQAEISHGAQTSSATGGALISDKSSGTKMSNGKAQHEDQEEDDDDDEEDDDAWHFGIS